MTSTGVCCWPTSPTCKRAPPSFAGGVSRTRAAACLGCWNQAHGVGETTWRFRRPCNGSVVTRVSPSAYPTAGRSARGPPPRRRRWPTSWRPRACACDASPCAGSSDGGWVTAARCSPSAGTTARPSPCSRVPWDATGWWSRSPAASGRSTPGGPSHWSGRPTSSTVRCPTTARSGPGSFRGWRSTGWGRTWSGWSGPGCSRAQPCWFPRCCWEPSWGRRCPPAPCRCWGC